MTQDLVAAFHAEKAVLTEVERRLKARWPGARKVITQIIREVRAEQLPGHYATAGTHCQHGHEYTPENTRVAVEVNRHCRKCEARRSNEYRDRQA